LPEGRRVGRALLSPAFDPNLVVSQPTEVEVTLLRAKAAYRNAFGYFTWRVGPDGVEILERRLVLEDASDRTLGPGATLVLRGPDGAPRTFEPGTRLGFFLIADAARRGLDGGPVPAETPAENARVAGGVFTTVDALNPEYRPGEPGRARHTAMVQLPGVAGFLDAAPFFALGFEDRDRRGAGRADDDFNDLVFAVRARTASALDETPVPRLSTPIAAPDADPDGDGHTGLDDFFPDDPHRATVFSGPTVTLRARDGGVRVQTQRVRSADGRTLDLVATFARDAAAEAETLHLGGLPPEVTGRVVVERVSDDGTHRPPVEHDLAAFVKTTAARGGLGRASVFSLPGLFAPGEGGEVRVALRFDAPLAVFPGRSEIPWRLDGVAPSARRILTGPEATPASILPHPWRLRVAP
jgi:hypothetical protein